VVITNKDDPSSNEEHFIKQVKVFDGAFNVQFTEIYGLSGHYSFDGLTGCIKIDQESILFKSKVKTNNMQLKQFEGIIKSSLRNVRDSKKFKFDRLNSAVFNKLQHLSKGEITGNIQLTFSNIKNSIDRHRLNKTLKSAFLNQNLQNKFTINFTNM